MGMFGKIFGSSENTWQEHVNQVRDANPGMPLKKLLRLAKKTYKK